MVYIVLKTSHKKIALQIKVYNYYRNCLAFEQVAFSMKMALKHVNDNVCSTKYLRKMNKTFDDLPSQTKSNILKYSRPPSATLCRRAITSENTAYFKYSSVALFNYDLPKTSAPKSQDWSGVSHNLLLMVFRSNPHL